MFDPAELAARLASLSGAGRCWIAYSGGLDSSVLLQAAAAVRDRLPGALLAVHVDHGLHPRSAEWRARCLARCAELAVPCAAPALELRPVPGESLEAVARAARYAAFARLLAPGDLLLTAHNREDQAETLLLALLRGGGVRGLAAMPFVAPLGAGRLVRPLLEVPRAALAEHARRLGLDWIEDPSNASVDFDRNYLRLRVMPVLRERWPACSATLARSAGHCAEAAGLVERLADATLDGLAGSRPGTVAIPALLNLDAPLARAVLRRWIRRRGLMAPDTAHLQRILDEVSRARPDANPRVVWPGGEIRRYRQELFALPPLPPPPNPALIWILPVVAGQAGELELPDGLGRLVWEVAADHAPSANDRRQDAAVPEWTLRFGALVQGCRVRPAGPSRSLKKLFQEAGIPPWLRSRVPMIFADGRLAAIPGLCRCHDEAAAAAEPQAGTGAAPCLDWRWSGYPWTNDGFFG